MVVDNLFVYSWCSAHGVTLRGPVRIYLQKCRRNHRVVLYNVILVSNIFFLTLDLGFPTPQDNSADPLRDLAGTLSHSHSQLAILQLIIRPGPEVLGVCYPFRFR